MAAFVTRRPATIAVRHFGAMPHVDMAERSVTIVAWMCDPSRLTSSRSKVLATRFSTRRVLFAFPKVDGAMVVYVKGLVESGQFTPIRRRQARTLDDTVETYLVETRRRSAT
jgi:hypothetical protein